MLYFVPQPLVGGEAKVKLRCLLKKRLLNPLSWIREEPLYKKLLTVLFMLVAITAGCNQQQEHKQVVPRANFERTGIYHAQSSTLKEVV